MTAPRSTRRRRAGTRGFVLALVGALTAMIGSSVPTMAADNGTVDAEVTVARAAACLEVSTGAVDFGTLAPGTADAPGSPQIVVTNCGDGDETLFASGTDAAGTNAAWSLVDSAETCADTLGLDRYHLGLATPAGAAIASLSTANKEVATLAAAGTATHLARISTACPGSSGSGTTLNMQITYLVTNLETPPIVLEELVMGQATADAAADFLLDGTRNVAVTSSCVGDAQVGCVGGVAVQPPPTVQVVGTNIVTTPLTADTWSTTATLAATTPSPIPVTVTLVGQCQLTIDTAAGASPTVQASSQLQFRSYPSPGGPKNHIAISNTTLNGLESSDIQISGSFGCSLLDAVVPLTLDTLTDSLAAQLGTAICGDPNGDSFIQCPPLP